MIVWLSNYAFKIFCSNIELNYIAILRNRLEQIFDKFYFDFLSTMFYEGSKYKYDN